MAIKKTGLRRKTITRYIPVQEFFASGLIESTGTTISADAGGAVFAEISSLACVGMTINATDDAISALRQMPPEFDYDDKEGVSITPVYTSTSATADTGIKWKLKYLAQTANSTAITAASTASYEWTDTAVAAAYALNVPTANVFGAGTFDKDSIYHLTVVCTSKGTAASDELHLLGLQFSGLPHVTGE